METVKIDVDIRQGMRIHSGGALCSESIGHASSKTPSNPNQSLMKILGLSFIQKIKDTGGSFQKEATMHISTQPSLLASGLLYPVH